MRIRESATKYKKVVVLCGWCKDDAVLTEEYQDAGYEVSHGICDKCMKIELSHDPNADDQVVDGFGERML